MNCKITFQPSQANLNMTICKEKQHIFIDILLKYANMTVEELVQLLQIPREIIHEVHAGKQFLTSNHIQNLTTLVFLFFSN